MGALGSVYGRRVNGEEFPLEASISKADVNGKKFFTVILRDISERKQAEEKIRDSEEKFSKIFYSSPSPIGIGEIHSGRLIDVNGSYASFFGYEREELIGRSASNLWADPAQRDAVAAKLGGGHSVQGLEVQFRRKHGDIRVGLLSMERVPVGEAPVLIAMITDITERKQAEAKIRATSELLRALALRGLAVREEERTNIAREIHDVLAQELTRLKIDLIWLAKRVAKPGDEATRATMAARIGEAVTQADTAISTVQRIATELRPVILDSLGLPAAVEWQVEDFARRTGLEFRVDAHAGESTLARESATAVFRILQESLTNIARHARATSVDVRFAEDAAAATLTVADNGCGITADQIANARSIGLAGMRERAQAFGGLLEIVGVPGAGTTVRVRIPFEGRATSCSP
jgi:PAS domain S-box-containing protein